MLASINRCHYTLGARIIGGYLGILSQKGLTRLTSWVGVFESVMHAPIN